MPKDWGSYKDFFVQFQLKKLNDFFEEVEETMVSPIERIVFTELTLTLSNQIRAGEVQLKRQQHFGLYTVDFYLRYLSSTGTIKEIIVECDGHDFHERTKKQVQHDKQRDRFFASRGFIVLRYSGSEIVNNLFVVSKDLLNIFIRADESKKA